MPTLDVIPGKVLYAQARPFAEFELLLDSQSIIRLVYKFDALVEEHGGVAFGCTYKSHAYALHYFPSPWLQRESYRVLVNGVEVIATGYFKLFRRIDARYSDGTIWKIAPRIWGTSVHDSAGSRIIQTSPQLGFILGRSKITIRSSVDDDRVLPILLLLTHLTTHHSE